MPGSQRRAQPSGADQASIELGRKLALEGAPEYGIPPCAACHGNPGAIYPLLAGQHAAYLVGQVRLRRTGHGPSTDAAAIVAPIAAQLSDAEIDAGAVRGASALTSDPPSRTVAPLPVSGWGAIVV